MGLQEPVCYTDSKIALHWINGLDRDWKPFVQNQADVIRKLVPPSQWRHCRRKDNPADIPSKEMAMSMSELVDNSIWFKGPSWLIQPEINDCDISGSEMPDECIS
jgi:hypothetical protein